MKTTTFSTRLKELRAAAGLTQNQLADRAGVGRPTIRGLEQGTRINPPLKTASLIAAALGVSLDALDVFRKESP